MSESNPSDGTRPQTYAQISGIATGNGLGNLLSSSDCFKTWHSFSRLELATVYLVGTRVWVCDSSAGNRQCHG